MLAENQHQSSADGEGGSAAPLPSQAESIPCSKLTDRHALDSFIPFHSSDGTVMERAQIHRTCIPAVGALTENPPDRVRVAPIGYSVTSSQLANGHRKILNQKRLKILVLNEQHGLLKRLCRGNLLDPQIPKGKVHRVADIGTGTGIWLDDVAANLASASAADREYTGFDISGKHFPADRPGMHFLEHDVLKPFPEEFHSQYDLVHIRLLVLALKKEDFKTAASNVAALLKPGGYFQWEEIETKNMRFIPPSEITTRVRSIMRNAAQLNGLTNTPCAEIQQNLTALGFADVRVKDYDSASREDLAAEAREWTKSGAKAGLYYALLRDGSGRTQEETRKLADELLEKYVGQIDSGVLPTLPLEMVVGRKM